MANEPFDQNPSATTSIQQLPAGSEDAKRLSGLVELKNYAIRSLLDPDVEILRGIDSLDAKYARRAETADEREPGPSPSPEGQQSDVVGAEQARREVERISDKDLVELDQLTVALTRLTYPVTIENVAGLADKSKVTAFASVLLWVGIGAAILCGVAMGVVRLDANAAPNWIVVGKEAGKGLLALLLGTVGAVLSVILRNGRLDMVVGVDEESRAVNKLRILLGALLGFVLFVLRPAMFNGANGDFELLIPLIGGYSATLVIGVLAKAATALEITLNLDERNTRSALRRPPT
jgi:hypothetical protein